MMKKVIYGFTILLGIVLISTNFIINDTSNIDHKTVKAGGTACKWISESGYGVGPYYVNDVAIANVNESTGRLTDFSVDSKDKIFSLFKCDNSNTGITMDGSLIYNADKTLFTGYYGYVMFDPSFLTGQMNLKKRLLYVVDGIELYSGSIDTGKIYTTDISTVVTEETRTRVNSINIFLDNYSLPYTIDYEVNSDNEREFTCVCAEY